MLSEQKRQSQSFGKDYRIRKTKDFNTVQKKAVKLHCKHFLILICKAAGKYNRLGITVSKKIDKRAVVRNKIKRRVRDIFRLNQHLLRENFDIIIIARKNAAEITYRESAAQILSALRNKGYMRHIIS